MLFGCACLFNVADWEHFFNFPVTFIIRFGFFLMLSDNVSKVNVCFPCNHSTEFFRACPLFTLISHQDQCI